MEVYRREGLNAKHNDWGSRLTMTKSNELRKAVGQKKCNYHSTGKPTHWPTDPNKIPDLLDLFISRKVSPNFIDHSAVILILSETVIKRATRPTLTNKITDWKSLRISKQDQSKYMFKNN